MEMGRGLRRGLSPGWEPPEAPEAVGQWERAGTYRVIPSGRAEAFGVVAAEAVFEEHLQGDGGCAALFERQGAKHERRGDCGVRDWEDGVDPPHSIRVQPYFRTQSRIVRFPETNKDIL